jgi:hypothetical protein
VPLHKRVLGHGGTLCVGFASRTNLREPPLIETRGRIEKCVLRNSARHCKLEQRGRPDNIRRYSDFSVAVVCQYWMTAVGVASTAREVAAGQVDLEAVPGGKSVTDVTEVDGQVLDTLRRKLARLAGRVAIHRADYTVHQQHGAPVGVNIDQFGDKIGIRAVRLHGQGPQRDFEKFREQRGDRPLRPLR